MNNEEMFLVLLNEMKSMKEEIKGVKQKMNERFDQVEVQLHRMEENQQQDVMEILGSVPSGMLIE